MGTVLVNYSGKTRKATINGREYIVAKATLIVPGVLNGSKGALYYPPEEIAKNFDAWNGIPLTNGHPAVSGNNVSARNPSIIQSHGLGHVYNVNITKNGRLRGEAWFDVKSCERVRPEILNKLKSGEPIELSTGLFTNNVPANNGAHHNGRQYTHVARDYRPDHLAILMDQQGACSLRDGCGVLTDNGRWVTTDDGNHLFLDDKGRTLMTGPNGKTVSSSAEKKGISKEKPNQKPKYKKAKSEPESMKPNTKEGDDIEVGGTKFKKAKDGFFKGEAHTAPDELSYRNYRHNRQISPDISPERYQKVFGKDAATFEARYRAETKPSPAPIKKTISDEDWDNAVAGLEKSREAYRQARKSGKKGEAKSRLNDARRFRKTLLGNAVGRMRMAQLVTLNIDKNEMHDFDESGVCVKCKGRVGNPKCQSKPTGNAMACTLNAAGFCVNCGGKGGKPGPCSTGDSGKKAGKGIDLATVPGKKLQARIEKLRGELSAISDEVITAGRGHETNQDIAAKSDPLSQRHAAVAGKLSNALGELRRRKEYGGTNKPIKPTSNHEGDDMATKKEKMVAFLTTNCDCWKGEKDAEILSNFDEGKLKTLIAATKEAITNSAAIHEIKEAFGAEAEGLTVNAMPAFVKGKALAKAPPEEMEDAEEEPAESEMEEVVAPPAKKGKKKMPVVANSSTARPEQPPTLNEWLASAPVEVQEVIRTAQAVEQGAKEKIVKTLVGNSSARTKDDRASLAKFLMAKPLAELNTLSKLSVNRASAPAARDPMAFLEAPTKPAPTVNYAGLGEDFDDDEPTANEDTVLDAPLGCPTANVDWAAEAKLIPTGAHRNK